MANTRVRKPWQSGKYTVYLWEFLYGLLQDPECVSLITWTNRESREFRINNTHEIATLWGTVKNRPTMDDKKLLRALRYYYKTKLLRKVKGHKAVYQFLSIPYESEGCDQEVKTSSEPGSTSLLFDPPEQSSTDTSGFTASDCSVRLNDHSTSPNCHENMENGQETTVENHELTEDSCDEFNGYFSREESLSEYSFSSDCSSKSLEELQADLMNNNMLEHLTDNMDFVFNDENPLGLPPQEEFRLE